jgi:Ca-activated chloride channel family protein
MIADLHFLRPWWFLVIIPMLLIAWKLWRSQAELKSWSAICDPHLLAQLVRYSGQTKRHSALVCLFFSFFWIIVSLTGPCWSKYPVPSYQTVAPRVVLLDLSDAMLLRDLAPDRLTRAKFKLHDLFGRLLTSGQIGLIAFTEEAFVVSPLTDDAKTIDELSSSLSADMMPVTGYRLDNALNEAANLIHQAGFTEGQVLVLTAETPNSMSIEVASRLAKQGIITSVIAVRANASGSPILFNRLAAAGGGLNIPFSNGAKDLDAWLRLRQLNQHYNRNQQDDVPVWRDEGRWFLIPALIFMLPAFRRGWLQRVML